MSEAAAKVMCADLAAYPEEQIMAALTRCRKELQGKLTLQAIITRLGDGRPSSDEAWAMLPKDEATSAVLTQETLAAMNPAMQLYHEGDEVGARMAFRETYNREVQQSRDKGVPVCWIPSLGFDKRGRDSVIAEALELGRISFGQAKAIIGEEGVRNSLGVNQDGLQKLAAFKTGLLKSIDHEPERL
jgi:hypothetical protein